MVPAIGFTIKLPSVALRVISESDPSASLSYACWRVVDAPEILDHALPSNTFTKLSSVSQAKKPSPEAGTVKAVFCGKRRPCRVELACVTVPRSKKP